MKITQCECHYTHQKSQILNSYHFHKTFHWNSQNIMDRDVCIIFLLKISSKNIHHHKSFDSLIIIHEKISCV